MPDRSLEIEPQRSLLEKLKLTGHRVPATIFSRCAATPQAQSVHCVGSASLSERRGTRYGLAAAKGAGAGESYRQEERERAHDAEELLADDCGVCGDLRL